MSDWLSNSETQVNLKKQVLLMKQGDEDKISISALKFHELGNYSNMTKGNL